MEERSNKNKETSIFNGNANETNELTFPCGKCKRTFKTYRGSLQHLRYCKTETKAITETSREINRNNGNSEHQPPALTTDDDLPETTPIKEYHTSINNAYEKMVYWRKNLFDIPKDGAGKAIIAEMTKLITEWT